MARIAERIREVAGRPLGAGGIPLVPSVGATCSGSGQRRPAALLQAALEAADGVSERGGDSVQLI